MKLNTTRTLQTVLLTVITASSWLISLPVQAKKIEELDRIIAVVNSDVITNSELDRQLSMVKVQLKKNKTELPPASVLRKQVLERMIVDRIQSQMAKRQGIRVSDETINRVIASTAKDNKLSLDQFRKVLEKDGIKFSEFRKTVSENLTLERLRSQIVDKEVNISRQEVENYLARSAAQGGKSTDYRISHIMVNIPEAATPEQIEKTRAKAEKILSKLTRGADFSKTAIASSDDQSALKGGDMGWLKSAQLPTLFEERLSRMKKGEISEIIRSPSGFHIIKLTGIRSKDDKHIVTQVLARHILIKPNSINTEDRVKATLNKIRKQVKDGQDFTKLAKVHSEDKGSAIEGGSLGWMSPGAFVPEFSKELEKLKPGQLSPVFKSRFGWHLVQLMSRRKHDDSEEHKRTQIQKLLYKRKANEVLNNWIRRIRDEAFVEYHLNN